MNELKMTLPITNYLNQKIVFDLLAVIEDGFSQVSNVTSTNTTNKSHNVKGDGELGFGVSNTFGLLNIKTKLKASFAKDKSQSDTNQQNEERVHTPTSLFSKLLTYLDDNNLINDISVKSDLNELQNGEFVKFNCQLHQNPLIEMLEQFEQMYVMLNRLGALPKKKGKQNQDEEVFKQIKGMKNALKDDEIIDLICAINNEDRLKAVIPVYMNYFYNRNMSELIDGNFTVVGKVVKIVTSDDMDDINLFRNTGFKLFKQNMIDKLFSSMANETNNELELPDIYSKVTSPCILVIPIAIYS